MNRLEYFKGRRVPKLLQTHPERICGVDVRNGAAKLLGDRIYDALQIPQT